MRELEYFFIPFAIFFLAFSHAQDTPFTVFANTPIVSNALTVGDRPQFTDPGAAIYHDGQFHMFHNGFTGWPAKVGIFYSTSPDSQSWTAAQETPVLTETDIPYATFTILASSVLVEDDGTWVLYFYTWDSSSSSASSRIGRATAPLPTGPWTADAEPILLPGKGSAWDAKTITAPSVIKTDDSYFLYYSGGDKFGKTSIGMAISQNGITWTKHNNPESTASEFAESDPIFVAPDIGWDRFAIHQPRIVQSHDGFVMLYRKKDQTGPQGIAVSQDGISWIRLGEAPFLKASSFNGRAIWFTEFIYQNDTYYAYIELGKGSTTEIYLATFTGSLTP